MSNDGIIDFLIFSVLKDETRADGCPIAGLLAAPLAAQTGNK
jgi:hypothetical protein